MKTKELINYLQTFPADTETCMLILNPEGRKRYEVENIIFFSDTLEPVIGLEVGEPIPFGEEETKAAEEDEAAAIMKPERR